MISRLNLQRIALSCAALALTAVSSFAQTHVYMMTNATKGNGVLDYVRNADGTLSLSATVATGGKGSGKFMNAAGGVTVHPTAPILLVVNPGDNSVSSLLIGAGGLTLASHVTSGGTYPVSVTTHNKKAYVLNQTSSNISGFNLNTTTGVLSKLAGSAQNLSGPSVAAAQVSFTPNGAYLVVTEKATSNIDVFAVSADGVAGPPTLFASSAVTPYGFAFDKKARAYITDANNSGLSSYSIPSGVMTPITPFASDGGNAACWISVNAAGTLAYVVDNLGGPHSSGGISVFSIDSKGEVANISGDVISLGPGGADLTLTPDGANLYYVVPGELTGSGSSTVNAFTVNANGSLTQITGLTTGVVPTAEGMASR